MEPTSTEQCWYSPCSMKQQGPLTRFELHWSWIFSYEWLSWTTHIPWYFTLQDYLVVSDIHYKSNGLHVFVRHNNNVSLTYVGKAPLSGRFWYYDYRTWYDLTYHHINAQPTTNGTKRVQRVNGTRSTNLPHRVVAPCTLSLFLPNYRCLSDCSNI